MPIKPQTKNKVMKAIAISLLTCAIGLSGCASTKEMAGQPETERQTSARLQKRTETFTGKVVFVDRAYRFALTDDPKILLRLTRARRESEFVAEQIGLRKYYEKTLSVVGTRQDDWIWGADVAGQWTPPGGDTGPNMNAPKPARP
jgi:hypothetical protein